MNRPLRIGLLAPELPPLIGGMTEFAVGLLGALAETDEVTLYTQSICRVPGSATATKATLSGRPAADQRELAGTPVDVWLALNAGLIPLARRLPEPFFAYLHGNDFLAPWLPCGPRWLEAIRKPYAVRVRHALRRAAVRGGLRSVRHLFTNSAATADAITTHLGARREDISVCHPGVHDSFFLQTRTPPGPALRILTVSRLTRHSRRKNIDTTLRAIADLRDEALRYTIVGDGDDRPRLEQLARELDIENRVVFRGLLSREELLRCYADSDLFVLASRRSPTDHEGFGIVYLEAAAAGVPSICSEEGGAIDAVQDGRNGLLIPSSSREAIAAGIRKFLTLRDRFAPEKVRGFAEGFRWSRIAARLRGEILARFSAAAEDSAWKQP